MHFEDSVYYWDLSSFYPEDNNFSSSDGIFDSVGKKQKVSSVERRLHTPTRKQGSFKAKKRSLWF